MRHYEVLFILKPTLNEDEIKTKVDFIKEIITKNGGEIASVIEMGTRKLAYEIKKYERGIYFVIYFKAPTQLISELVRNMRITEEIIRFLTIKYETKAEISAWEKLCKGYKFSQAIKKPKKEPKKEAVELSQNEQNVEEYKE